AEAGVALARPGAGADAAAQGAILDHHIGAEGGDGDEEPQRLVTKPGNEAAGKVEPDEHPFSVAHRQSVIAWPGPVQAYRIEATVLRQRARPNNQRPPMAGRVRNGGGLERTNCSSPHSLPHPA